MSACLFAQFADLMNPSVRWADVFSEWIEKAEADAARRRAAASPRAGFLEPLPVAVAPRPSLQIRVPALRTWRCLQCSAVLQEDFTECEDCAAADEEHEEDEEEQNCWYCRYCDDFCSNGLGICVRCELNYGR